MIKLVGQQTFFCDEEYVVHRQLVAEWSAQCGVVVWAYGLVPNHVQLIVAPHSEEELRRAIGEAHRRYSRRINFREGWRGNLRQRWLASTTGHTRRTQWDEQKNNTDNGCAGSLS